jgi:hypothetical protein
LLIEEAELREIRVRLLGLALTADREVSIVDDAESPVPMPMTRMVQPVRAHGVHHSPPILDCKPDPVSPPQVLTFTLLAAPAGATLTTNTGIFRWRAPIGYANTSTIVTLAVNDNGFASLGATQSFNVLVNPVDQPSLLAPLLSNGLLTIPVTGPIGPD